MKLQNSIPVWAEIHLDRLCNNLQVITEHLKPSTKIMAVVKGNAYGHGAVEIATVLEQNGIEFFAVATVEEGVQLRRSGISGAILLLEIVLPEQLDLVVNYYLTPTIYDFEFAELLAAKAGKTKRKIKYHLKIDTGSSGLGILPQEFPELFKKLQHVKWLELEGIYTHLTSDYRGDDDAVRTQIFQFNQLLSNLKKSGVTIPYIHMASSLAVLSMPETHFNMVRPGILLYGIPPSKEFENEALQPVMQLKSRIVSLKKLAAGEYIGTYHMKITATQPMVYAIVPVGYADAFFLLTTRKGFVLIKEKRVPIIGQARMNQILVDVTGIPEAVIGDEVVIIGEQGEARITAGEATVAAGIAAMNCESVCLLASRVPRIYLQDIEDLQKNNPIVLKQKMLGRIEVGSNG